MYLIPLATSLEEVSDTVFWENVLLYHNSPHLVNRRLTAALQLLFLKVNFKSNTIKSLSELLTRTSILYEVRKLHELSEKYVTCDLIKSILEPYDKSVSLENVTSDYFKSSEDDIFVTVKILLPRQQYYESCIEVAILDKKNKVATFLAVTELNKKPLAPTFPYFLECSSSGYRICVDIENVEDSASEWLVDHLFTKLENWIQNYKNSVKTLPSLSLISVDTYTKLYHSLKEKYGRTLVKAWPEKTDPLKYVYEDVAIATYLITLWHTLTPNYKPAFVDLGCGNGLLVHILNSEGYSGHGIDLRKRKIWDWYPDSTVLKTETITPSGSCLFPGADWIIGNHSDELTPWIPVIAARSSYKANFFLLPCCCYEFSGQKYIRKNTSISGYTEYLTYVCSIAMQCGFTIKTDKLRIPSTRRTCIISFNRTYKPEQFADIDYQISNLICEDGHKNHSTNWTSTFKARLDFEVVRNCTQLDKSLITRIVQKIVTHLLEKYNPIQKNEKSWNKGRTVSLNELANIVLDDLKNLKKENGGIQTLLKNHRYIFEVDKGTVGLREPSTVELTSGKYKQKLCWFNQYHPEGCLNDSESCAYNH